jgi:arylsulfatase A-like enzyme
MHALDLVRDVQQSAIDLLTCYDSCAGGEPTVAGSVSAVGLSVRGRECRCGEVGTAMAKRPRPLRRARRTRFWGDAAARLFLLSGLALVTGCGRGSPRPNVLFLLIDSLRYDHLGFSGYARPTSPCLDSLAADGAAFVASTAQEPQTLGSVPSVMTGRYPLSTFYRTSTAIPDEPVPVPAASLGDGLPTVARMLQKSGYTTAAFITSALVNRRIWGVWEQFDHWDRSVECCTGDCAERINDQVIRWLAESGDEPWLCYVHYNDVHHPYDAPQEYASRFSRSYGKLPVPTLDGMRGRARKGDLTREELEHIVGMYDAEIAYLDSQIRRLLREISALGSDRGLLVVVASDHGDEFYEHGDFGHTRTLYEELTRVPLILSWSDRIPSGILVDARVRNVDIIPTITDLVGAETPQGVQGLSLLPYLGRERRGRAAFSRMWDPRRTSVKHGRWKLWRNPGEGLRLYDLASDPAEQRNLADVMPDTVRSLRTMLDEWEGSLPALPAPAERPVGPVLDSTAVSKLRALGYIE